MLEKGIYEHIINQEIDKDIQLANQSGLVCIQQPIDDAESPQILSNYLAKIICQKLEDIEDQQKRVELINHIMMAADLQQDSKIVS